MVNYLGAGSGRVASILEWHGRRRKRYDVFSNYARGKHTISYGTKLFHDRYGKALEGAVNGSLRLNMCPGVISGFTEGIAIESWGEQNDQIVDKYDLARLEAGVNSAGFRDGNAFILVWPDARTNELAPRQINAEDIVPVVDEESPMDPLEEVWHFGWDDEGRIVDVYDREKRARYRLPKDELYEEYGEDMFREDYDLERAGTVWYSAVGLPEGRVPVFWFKLDAPAPMEEGRSILSDVLPVQDAINKNLCDLIVLSERYAIPLIYVLSYQSTKGPMKNPYLSDGTICDGPSDTPSSSEPPNNQGPSTTSAGPPYNPTSFGGYGIADAGPAAWFQWDHGDKRVEANGFDPDRQQVFATDAKGPMGIIPPPDLMHLANLIDRFAASIASVVGLPQYFFSGDLKDVPSGETLRNLQVRRLSRIRRWQLDNDLEWRRLGAMLGMTNPKLVWKPANYQSELEKHTIALNMLALGFPLETIYKYLGHINAEELAANSRIPASTPIVDNIDAVTGVNNVVDNT